MGFEKVIFPSACRNVFWQLQEKAHLQKESNVVKCWFHNSEMASSPEVMLPPQPQAQPHLAERQHLTDAMKIANYTIIKEQARVSCLLNTFPIKRSAKVFFFSVYVILLSWLFLILPRPINLFQKSELKQWTYYLSVISQKQCLE